MDHDTVMQGNRFHKRALENCAAQHVAHTEYDKLRILYGVLLRIRRMAIKH